MAKIGIIGTGRIGSHLAEQLLVSNDIKEIHLANRDQQHLEGRLISLQLKTYLSDSKTKIHKLNFNNINNLDIIIICIKENYDPRELLRKSNMPSWIPLNLRYIGLLLDIPIVESLCVTKLKEFKGTIAVITNPIEIMTFFVAEFLPKSTVVGLGASVDSARIAYIIKNEKKINLDKYSCPVAGEHGNDIIAVSNLWAMETKLSELSKKQVTRYVKEATSMGFDIVNKLGFTLQDCVPVFIDDIKWILGLDRQESYRSIAVSKNASCYSRPVKLTKKNQIIEYTNYSNIEIIHLIKSENRIRAFIKKLKLHHEYK